MKRMCVLLAVIAGMSLSLAQAPMGSFIGKTIVLGVPVISQLKVNADLLRLQYPVANFDLPWTYQIRIKLNTPITAKQLATIRSFSRSHKRRYVRVYLQLDSPTRKRGAAYGYTGKLIAVGVFKPGKTKPKTLNYGSQVIVPLVFQEL